MTGNEGLTVGRVAELLGVTVRTLHHYEQVGLAGASLRSWSGYRLYTAADVAVLERVVFLRRLGLSLEEIARVRRGGDAAAVLRERRACVMQQVEELTGLLDAIDTALEAEMGTTGEGHGYSISRAEQQEIFGDRFAGDLDDYQAEAQERWGDSPQWAQSQERAKSYSREQWEQVKAEADAVMADLSAARAAGEPATSEPAMDAAEAHRQHITRWFYECTPQIHRGLGDLYLTDDRFRQTYEGVAEGLAQYARDAHAANADRQESA